MTLEQWTTNSWERYQNAGRFLWVCWHYTFLTIKESIKIENIYIQVNENSKKHRPCAWYSIWSYTPTKIKIKENYHQIRWYLSFSSHSFNCSYYNPGNDNMIKYWTILPKQSDLNKQIHPSLVCLEKKKFK